ncbi:hypothetical protein [Paraburkholderia adhaesiva]|uniref:hypothetical protein n=1 Tax=Paraburkholderia adhaesiva TaxID=2883244 RepID=UPI001F30623F|nr:hypothetical protein [Paraburkholderia adhaesiva]
MDATFAMVGRWGIGAIGIVFLLPNTAEGFNANLPSSKMRMGDLHRRRDNSGNGGRAFSALTACLELARSNR